jgi:hypothetical protein
MVGAGGRCTNSLVPRYVQLANERKISADINCLLLGRVLDRTGREWYIKATVEDGLVPKHPGKERGRKP